ncbi:MAG: tRNA (adenosine(37)-N6)-dimethylallyltransferase MiaA [Microgenomates group bacterium]
MNRLLVICGPTATGKTALGIKLAKKFNGEIVSADSRQVYKGMDIGTGKDLPANSKFKILNSKQIKKLKFQNSKSTIGYYEISGVKVWLYDVVEPNYQFNVADYVKCANLVIENIWRQEKLPILVGGTGFYIKGVVDGIETLGIPPDWELRKKLEKWGIEKLQKIIQQLAPHRWQKMNESDRKNPRRLIRAIEIIKNSKIKNSLQVENQKLKFQKDFLMIGLRAPSKFLYQRIDQRVEERITQGIEKEIKDLIESGYNWKNSVLGTTIGYKEWKDFFEGKINKIEVIKRWQFAEHGYARRQITWFKKEKRIIWFDITQKSWQNKVIKKVKEWLDERKNPKN